MTSLGFFQVRSLPSGLLQHRSLELQADNVESQPRSQSSDGDCHASAARRELHHPVRTPASDQPLVELDILVVPFVFEVVVAGTLVNGFHASAPLRNRRHKRVPLAIPFHISAQTPVNVHVLNLVVLAGMAPRLRGIAADSRTPASVLAEEQSNRRDGIWREPARSTVNPRCFCGTGGSSTLRYF